MADENPNNPSQSYRVRRHPTGSPILEEQGIETDRLGAERDSLAPGGEAAGLPSTDSSAGDARLQEMSASCGQAHLPSQFFVSDSSNSPRAASPAPNREEKLAELLKISQKQNQEMERRMVNLEMTLRSIQRQAVQASTKTSSKDRARYVEGLISNIPRFNGVICKDFLHKMQVFITSCQTFVAETKLEEHEKLNILTGRLDGLAAAWWQQVVQEVFQGDSSKAFRQVTGAGFLREIKAKFTPANVEISIHKELKNMRQGNENITTFISRFRTVAGLSTTMHEATRAFFFLEALHPSIANLVVVQCTDHCKLSELIAVAERVSPTATQAAVAVSDNSETPKSTVALAAPVVTDVARDQCRECRGYGHFRAECPAFLKRQPAARSEVAGKMVGKQKQNPKPQNFKKTKVCCTENDVTLLSCNHDANIAPTDFVIDSGAGRHMIAASEGSLARDVKGDAVEKKKHDNNQVLISRTGNNTNQSLIKTDSLRGNNRSLKRKRDDSPSPPDECERNVCKVRLADGKVLDGVELGKVTAILPASHSRSLDSELQLDGALAVTGLKYNLFSVPAANKSGTNVHFWQDGSVSMDREGQEVVRTDPTDLSIRKLKLHLFQNSVRDDPSRYPGEFTAFSADVQDDSEFMRWHESFGHPGLRKMRKLLASVCCDLRIKIPSELRCDACQQSKQTRRIKGSGGTQYSLLEVVHSDICEMSALSLGKARYMLTFTDDFSRFCKIYLIASKDAETVVNKFAEFINWAERTTSQKVLRLRSDHGSEYKSGQMVALCKSKGIVQEFANVYSPSQNGTAERINRTLLEIMRAIMFQSRMPGTLWAEIMMHGCYLYNNRPHSKIGDATPASRFFGEKDTRRVFSAKYCYPVGCAVHMTLPTARRNKLAPKTVKGWFVGVGLQEPGVRLWVPEVNEVYTSSHIKVWPEERFKPESATGSLIPVSVTSDDKEYEIDCIVDERKVHGKRLFRVRWKGYPNPDDDTWQSYDSLADTIALDKWESPCEEVTHACLASAEEEAPNVRQALLSNNHSKWWDAMCREYDAISEQGTWEVVPRPPNRKVVSVTWVMRTKQDIHSGHKIYKARLCARGFTQIPGVDFDATYAPTVSRAGLRLTVAIAVQLGMHLHAIDCKNAFLNGEIDREIYLEQPPYFFQPGTTNASHVCRLKKALYGLKQSPLIWNQALHSALIAAGFERMHYEPCLYVHRSRGGVAPSGSKADKNDKQSERNAFLGLAASDPMFIIIAVYVDDLTIAAMTTKGLAFAKSSIASVFKMKDEGEVKKVIGIEFEKLKDGYILHQRGYLNQVLSRFGMNMSNSLTTPMESGNYLQARCGSEVCADSTLYRSQIGALLFAATCTRPDLCVSTNICARYVEDPCSRHYGAVKRIMRYVRGTLDFGLTYKRNFQPLTITAYCDADFARDVGDSKSTSGYVVFLNGCAVSWKAIKQKSTSTSTVEAEYIAASTACKEVMWLRWLIEEILGGSVPTPVLWVDNEGARQLAQNDSISEKTKHIRYSYHFVKECVNDGIVELKHVASQDNVADMMTKPLARVLLEKHRDSVNLLKF
jgi:transposase InsO family protein